MVERPHIEPIDIPEMQKIKILMPGISRAGDNIALSDWRKGVMAEIKTGDDDIVTATDRKVEEYLIEYIKQKFTDVHFIAEESGGEAKKNGFTIDGIDGTSSFSKGGKDWSISVSRLENGEVTLGIVYSPANNELYYAKKGQGAYLYDGVITRRINVSKEDRPSYSTVGLGQDIVRRYDRSDIEERFKNKKASRSHYAIASSALMYGRLASGQIDVAVQMGQPIWDIAPGIVIVKEAGGRFTNWDGQEQFEITRERANNIVASNGLLHNQALQIIREQNISRQENPYSKWR